MRQSCRKHSIVRAGFALALGFALIGQAAAQLQPPPRNCVLFDGQPTAVKGLAWNGSARMWPNGPQGYQYASFGLSVRFNMPTGFHYVAGSFHWSPLWSNNVANPPPVLPGLYVKPTQGNEQTATGEAYGTGVAHVTCNFQITDSSNVPVDETVTGDCAVIGGPLRLSVTAGDFTYEDWSGHEFQYRLPAQELNDVARPFYLQYFGFDPRNGTPTDMQAPRATGLAQMENQPSGTVFSWTRSGSALSVAYGGESSDGSMGVIATSAGLNQQITCHVTLHYVGQFGEADGEADDDTASTPQVQADPTVMKVNAFNSDVPTSFSTAETVPLWLQSNGQDVTSYLTPATNPAGPYNVDGSWCGDRYSLRLNSQGSLPMAGVWIQERWTVPPTGPYILVNPSGRAWATHGPESMDYIGQITFDSIYYGWIASQWDPFATPPGFPTWTGTHQYVAATRSTSLTGPGIVVGTYDVQWIPGSTKNSFGSTVNDG